MSASTNTVDTADANASATTNTTTNTADMSVSMSTVVPTSKTSGEKDVKICQQKTLNKSECNLPGENPPQCNALRAGYDGSMQSVASFKQCSVRLCQ